MYLGVLFCCHFFSIFLSLLISSFPLALGVAHKASSIFLGQGISCIIQTNIVETCLGAPVNTANFHFPHAVVFSGSESCQCLLFSRRESWIGWLMSCPKSQC
jgi:hypothetical protein